MQLSMKCSVATHCLIYIHYSDKVKITSNILSESTGCNPVIIRNLLGALSKAGIISVTRGPGGYKLLHNPSEISLWTIFSALEPNGTDNLFGMHNCAERSCLLAQNIADVLAQPYQEISDSIRASMEKIYLSQLIKDFERRINYNQEEQQTSENAPSNE